MTPDLWTLVATVGLALLHITAASTAAKLVTGMRWSLGPRDNPIPLTGIAGRLTRAQSNFYESLPLFAILVLVTHVSGEADRWTFIGAQTYFWARLVYMPAYASGIPWLRTIPWAISMLALLLIASRLF